MTHDCATEATETATRPEPRFGRLTITTRCQVCRRVLAVTETTIDR